MSRRAALLASTARHRAPRSPVALARRSMRGAPWPNPIGIRIDLEDRVDKPRHPQVIRTWTVARIKIPLHPAQLAKPRREPCQASFVGRQYPSSAGFQRPEFTLAFTGGKDGSCIATTRRCGRQV